MMWNQCLQSRIPNPGIPAVFANHESQDWQRPNPGILGLQKYVKKCTFWSVK